MGNFEGSNRSSRSCISTEKDDAGQPRKIESRSPDGGSKSGFVIRSCRKFTCPQDRPGISVRHGEARQPKADLAPLLKMRRATKIYQQYAGPADRTDIPHVRMPVRQSNLGFREDVRPPQLADSLICPRLTSRLTGRLDQNADRKQNDRAPDRRDTKREHREFVCIQCSSAESHSAISHHWLPSAAPWRPPNLAGAMQQSNGTDGVGRCNAAIR